MTERRCEKRERTAEELQALKAERARYQKDRPTRADLAAGGAVFATMGEVMALRHLVDGLRRERERRGLTLKDVAHLSGIDEPALSRIETGRNLNPTFATLGKVARALGLTVEFTLRGVGGEAAVCK